MTVQPYRDRRRALRCGLTSAGSRALLGATRRWKTAVAILASPIFLAVGAVGCSSDLLGSSARRATPVTIRLENATASTTEFLLEALDASGDPISAASVQPVNIPVVTIGEGGVNFGVLTPVGAGAAVADGSLLPGGLGLFDVSATVQVPGFAATDGALYCGQMVRISAQTKVTEGLISLSGAGAGTPAFDEGSVGETGERYLRAGVDFECGETIVVRVGQDASGAGSSSAGAVAVIVPGASSPFGPIPNPGSSAGGQTPATIAIEVENRGAVIGTLRLEVTPSSGAVQEHLVTVPPSAVTTGTFACGTTFRLSASYPDPETPDDQDTERLVILTGDGTGALGFDEASVSRTGERYLVVGTHVSCGDTVHVVLRDDVEPIGFSGIGAFSGTVTVFQGN